MLLSGVIYLLPPSRLGDDQSEFRASVVLGQLLVELLGNDAFAQLVIATTFWDSIADVEALQREHDITSGSDKLIGWYWHRDATSMRWKNDRDSSQKIIDYIIHRQHRFVTRIQREMVDEALSLRQTSLGQWLWADLACCGMKEEAIRDLFNDAEHEPNQAHAQPIPFRRKRVLLK